MLKKCCLFLLLSLSLFTVSFAAVEPLDGVVAIVNDQVITQSKLDQAYQQVLTNLKQMHITQMPSASELRRQVLKNLILTDIQLQMAKQQGITASNALVEHSINDIAKQNHMSLAAFKAKLTSNGITFAEYKKTVHDQLVVHKLQQQAVASDIEVSKAEIRAEEKRLRASAVANNEYHIANILVPLPEVPSTQQVQAAQAKVDHILGELKQGADFQQVAMAESSAPNALKGGDFGWRKLAELPSAYAKRLPNMQVGQVSAPIRTGNGFHIIKMLAERKHEKAGATAAIYRRARDLVFQRKMAEKLPLWLQRIEDGAYIKTFKQA